MHAYLGTTLTNFAFGGLSCSYAVWVPLPLCAICITRTRIHNMWVETKNETALFWDITIKQCKPGCRQDRGSNSGTFPAISGHLATMEALNLIVVKRD